MRSYLRCPRCLLTFVPPEEHLDPAVERRRYDLHENDPQDERYRAHLRRLLDPLAARLPPAARGLDYGSGPGPTLHRMFEECGHPMAIWDPFYAPDPAPLERVYDFVTCTETAEHFRRPAEEFARLHSLLAPGGWLGLMTERLEEDSLFPGWYYAREDTHVCFYREETLRWIANRHGWTIDLPGRGVALFQRARDPGGSGP